VVGFNEHEIYCNFTNLQSLNRDELINKLYTGGYDNEVHEVSSIKKVFVLLLRRAFGKEKK